MIEWNDDVDAAPAGPEILAWWQGEAYKACVIWFSNEQRWYLDGARGFESKMKPSHWAYINPPAKN